MRVIVLDDDGDQVFEYQVGTPRGAIPAELSDREAVANALIEALDLIEQHSH
jgi:hypothetical protein